MSKLMELVEQYADNMVKLRDPRGSMEIFEYTKISRETRAKIQAIADQYEKQDRSIENLSHQVIERANKILNIPEWISVKDRLPSSKDKMDYPTVLVATKDGNRYYTRGLATYIDESSNYEPCGGWYDYDTEEWIKYEDATGRKVTHWQPLPNPPKESKDE